MKTRSIVLIGCGAVLLIFVLTFFLGFMIGLRPQANKVSKDSWLVLNPSGNVADYNELRNQGPFSFVGPSVDDICGRIRHASTDGKIKGIIIRPGFAQINFSNLNEINAALDDFKKSGKPVYAHAEMLDQKDYLLCAMADTVYMDPSASGGLILEGITANIMFYKEALQKIGVKMHVMQSGEFKGAGELYNRTSLSPGTEANMRRVFKNRYDLLKNHIGKLRGLDSLRVAEIFEQRPDMIINAASAQQYGLIDGVSSWDQLKQKLGIEDDDKLVSLEDYNDPKIVPGGQIALINLSGNIAAGSEHSFGFEQTISAAKVEKILRQVKRDGAKAVVLRINSPGGSALESELIYQKLQRLDIPVVVSMGVMAASGGYYISCGGDYIFADPYTITGSIGVIMAIPEAVELGNKLGIDSQTINYGKFSGGVSIFEKYDPEMLASLERNSKKVYTEFKQRVMTARKISSEQIDAVAEGRIFSAQDAKDIHLIDEVGGIQAAIDKAAKLAKLTKYGVKKYPARVGFFELLKQGNLFRMVASVVRSGDLSLQERLQQYLRQTIATNQWLYFCPYKMD